LFQTRNKKVKEKVLESLCDFVVLLSAGLLFAEKQVWTNPPSQAEQDAPCSACACSFF